MLKFFRMSLLVFFVLSAVLSCDMFDNSPGSFQVAFEWPQDDKPDFSEKKYYAWVLLEEWVDGDSDNANLLMQTPATALDSEGKAKIDLSDVKYGDNRVVKVEIRGTDKTQDRVLYFGRSELFSFSSKDKDKVVNVELQTQATPGTGGSDSDSFALQIMQNGNVVTKIKDTTVDVRVKVLNGSRVIIANSLSILEKYINDKNSVSEGFADKNLSELKENSEGYYDLEGWNLDSGLDFDSDAGGERIVYGKLVNDDGYMSETVQASVNVDKTAPSIINPVVDPNPAKLGDTVVVSFSFTEAVNTDTLELDWDGLSFEKAGSESGNLFTYTFQVTDSTVEKTYALKGSAYDEIGNGPVEFVLGDLKIDKTLPSVSDEKVSVTDDKTAIKTGDKVTVTFKVSEELQKDPEVTIDGKKFTRNGDSTEPYSFVYTVSDSDIESMKTILVSLVDPAGNSNVVELNDKVTIDNSAPVVINPTVTPAGNPGMAGLGSKMEIRFNISEPVSELKFFVNGTDNAVSGLFTESVSDLTYTYTRTVQSDEAAQQYVFTVSAVDNALNTLDNFELGTVAVDIVKPDVESFSVSATNVRLMEEFNIDLLISEELASLTVLVGSKDISAACIQDNTDKKKYICGHQANMDSDEGDGVKQFSVQMVDKSGNSNTVQLKNGNGSPATIEYDVTPPEIVNPVIAPEKANLDSTVDVRFSFTEDVQNLVIDWGDLAGKFVRYNEETNRKLFIYKRKITADDPEGVFPVVVTAAEDLAGNPISGSITIGSVEIDNSAPEIFNSAVKVNGSASRVYVVENDQIEVIFEVHEEISDYSVRSGLKKIESCVQESVTDGTKYTCTYGTPSADDGEGLKDVTVEVKDIAGNSATYPVGQLTYDMSLPQLSSAIVIPERVSSSSTDVKVQFGFSEDVMINAGEIYITPENFGPELTLNCNNGTDYGKSFTCTYVFDTSDTRVENYNVTVIAEDRAGNSVSDLFIGEIVVDREKPYILSSNIDPVSVRQNELFTISFAVNETLDAAPVVKVGDKELPGTECSEISAKNYSCTHTANGDGDETDGVKSVTVNLRDSAGNLSIITLPGNVTYDATRPELLNPVIIPEGTANRYNSTVQVRFSFSEKIDYPASFSFSVLSSEGGSVPSFNCEPVNSNNQSFTCQTTFADEDTTVDKLTFRVAASDLAGNELNAGNAPAVIGTLDVDRSDPEIVFESVTPAVVNTLSTQISVVFTVNETLKEAPAVSIGSGLSSNTPSSVSGLEYTYIFSDMSLLSDGEKEVSVTVTDSAGNSSTEAYSGKIVVDRTAPSVIASTVAPAIANSSTASVTVNFTFSEKIDGFDKNDVTVTPSGVLDTYSCSNESGDEQSFSCVFDTSSLGSVDGNFTFFVTAADKKGNTLSTDPSQIGTLTVDTNAPQLTFDSVSPLTVNKLQNQVTVQFTVDTVPQGNPVVRLGSDRTLSAPQSVTNGGKTFTYIFDDLSGIVDGPKNVSVDLKDSAGNTVTATYSVSVNFDRTDPALVSESVAPAVVNKDTNQIVVSFAFSEKMTALTNANVTVSPSGVLPAHSCTSIDNQSYTCTVDTSSLGTDKDGTYTYSVTGSDVNGNAMASPAVIGSVTVDRTDLTITLNSFSPVTVNSSTASVTIIFTLSDTPDGNPVVKLGTTKQKNTPSSVSGKQYTYIFDDLSGMNDGEKTITISAKDSAGNAVSEDFTGPVFDRTAPTVVSESVAPAVVNKDTNQIVVSFAFSEKMTALTNANVTVSPSGVLPAHSCTSIDNQSYTCTVDTSSLGTDKDGTYTYSVTGSDVNGNAMASPAVIGSVTVDRTDLTVTLNSFTPATVNSSAPSVTVIFTLSDTPDGNPVVKLGTTKQKSAPSSVSGKQYTYIFDDLSGMNDGEKTITISAKDSAGNAVSEDFTGPVFDRTAPTVVSNSVAPVVVNKDTSEVRLSFTFSEKMTVLTNANVTVSPSGVLPAHSCTSSDSQSYTCTISMIGTGSEKDGIYAFSVNGSDINGNAMAAPFVIGNIAVDRTDAIVTFVSVNPLTVNAAAGSISVVFDVSELPGGNPVVSVGSELSSNIPSSVSDLRYTYTFNDLSSLSDGLKTIKVYASDLKGNSKETLYGNSIAVDRTPPVLLAGTVAPAIANSETVSVAVSFAFSEKIDAFVKGDVTVVPSGILTNYVCTNASGDEQTYSCLFDTTALGEYEGSFTFYAAAEDKAGNPMAVNPSQIGVLTVDRNAPELTFDSVTPQIVSKAVTSVTVQFTVNDVPDGNPVVRIGTELSKSSPVSVMNGGKTYIYVFDDLTGVSDGNRNVFVDLKDEAGNVVSATWSGVIKFDRTSPTVISSSVAPAYVNTGTNSLNLSFSFSEPMSAFSNGNLTVSPSGVLPGHVCTALDGSNQTISCVIDTSGLNSSANDIYTFKVTGTDISGNPMASEYTLGMAEVDRTPPDAVLNSMTPLNVNKNTSQITVIFTVSESLGAVPSVKIGSEKTLTVPSSVSGLQYTYVFSDLSGISDGPKTVSVQLKDPAGNTLAKDFSGLFFDRTLPEVVSSSVAPSVVNNDTTQLQISFTFNEKMTPVVNSNVTVIPSGKLPAHNCSSPSGDNQSFMCVVDVSSIDSTADGGYAYYVTGTDIYGNTMVSPAVLGTVYVDRTDPVITFNSFSPSVVNSLSTSISVVFTLSETPASNPVVKLGTFKTKDAPFSVAGLQYTYVFNDLSGMNDGEKTITISAKDSAGNAVSEDFTGPVFDRTAPTVVSESVAPAVVNKDTNQIVVSFTFSEKMTALTNANVTVSPSGVLPAHNCVSVDNQSYTCTVDTSSLGTDKDGTYTYSVTGSDVNGNAMASPAVIGSVTVDRTDPDASIISVLVYDQDTGAVKTPQIARAGDYIIARFNLSETLNQNPVVTLGGRVMTRVGANCLSGTCNYRQTVLSTDGDGSKTLTIELNDVAGNTHAFPYADAAVFDVTAPQMHSNSLSPEYAKEGTQLEARFSFSEPVDTSTMQVSSTIPFTKDTGTSTDSVFLYKTTVTSATTEGSVTFSVKAKDAAGNWINSGGWQLVGSSTVDRTAPQFVDNTCVVEVSSGYTLPGGVQAGAAGDSVYLKCNITTEAPLAYDPVLMIGGYEATLKETCETGYNYCYNYDITGDEGDGFKMVTVEVEDYAGNIKTGYPDDGTPGTTQQVAFDFTGPQMVSHSFDRYPSFSSARDGVNKVLNLSVKDPYSDEFVTVYLRIYADEDINTTLPVALSSITGTLFDFGSASVSGNEVSFQTTMSDSIAEGYYNFKVTWYDMLGNQKISNLLWRLYVDKTEPSSGDIDADQMVFKRFPLGSEGNVVPYASLIGGIMAVPSENIVKIMTYSSDGQYMGDAEVSSDGSFSISNLLGSTASEIYINPVKYSGEKIEITDYTQVSSLLPRVPNVEWTANLNNKVAGQEWPNPHSFYNRAYFTDYLRREGSYDEEEVSALPAQADIGGEWYKLAEPSLSDNCSMPAFTSGRMYGAAAYDSTRGLVYVFGGEWSQYEDATRCELNDTHAWNGYFWERKAYGGAVPPVRLSHSMVYDVDRDRIVVFGGGHIMDVFTFKRSDTWEWDGTTWSMRSFDISPSARSGACMAYDRKRGVSVLFGGATDIIGTQNNETWEYDGTSWTKKISSGNTPTSRTHCGMVYSEERGTVLMYGGSSSSTALTDLWEWNGSEWISLDSSGPALKEFGLAWNSVEETLYLLGGTDESYNYSNEMWVWNGSTWNQSSTVFPLDISGALLVYNAGEKMMMVVGGLSMTTGGEKHVIPDTYGLVHNSWVVLDRGTHPDNHSYGAAAYDSGRKKVVMFGGNDGTNDLNLTWEFDGLSWQKITTSTTPTAQNGHAMTYMAAAAQTVLYTTDAKTYTYNGTNWTLKLSSSLPGNRESAKMVYDSNRNVAVLFGGGSSSHEGFTYGEGTYEYNITANTWTKVCGSGTSCSTEPNERDDFAMVFDATRNVTVLFGGRGFMNDTWEWNGTSWTEVTVSDPEGDGNPNTQIISPEMIYNSESGSVFLIGGNQFTDTFIVWKYNGTSYKLISETRETLRKYYTGAYFADTGLVLFHGGLDLADSIAEGTLVYNIGKTLRPMQMFSVKTDSANIPGDARIEDVKVRFTGGAQGFENNTEKGSIGYDLFYGGSWIPLGDIDYDADNSTEYSFTIKDRRLINGMRYGNRDTVNIAFKSTVPAETVSNDSKTAIQNVEMTIRYNLDGNRFSYPKYGSYYISNTAATWQNARNDCISRGGDLLILNSSEEQEYIESLPDFVNTNYYWIGYHDIEHDLEWRSVSGKYVWQGTSAGSAQHDAYTNWYTNYPTSSSTLNCVVMNKSVYGGKWYNSTCNLSHPYICELERENDYIISTDTKTWEAARTTCLNYGGDLVTIDGYNEQKNLETLLSGSASYWIGFTDRDVNGEWRWVNGSNRWNGSSTGSSYFYTNWYTSRPYSGSYYNYASIYSGYNYKWNSPYYTVSEYYVCEFETPQFCSLNDDGCSAPETCCSGICNTDDQECVSCIEVNYHGCEARADCCDDNPCNTGTKECVTSLSTGESTCDSVSDCSNAIDECSNGKCCRSNQEECSATNDCCNASDICYSVTDTCCRPIGHYCTSVSNCCFGVCTGTLLRKTCECIQYNQTCSGNSECCSGTCTTLGKCALGSTGKYCYSSLDCSSGICLKNTCR